MKTTFFQMLLLVLLFNIPDVLFGKISNIQEDDYSATEVVYLTFQAENGSFRQVSNMDGTITIYVKPYDIIKVNSILLNDSDVSLDLVKNHYTLPVLTENATLEITFERAATSQNRIEYSTITSN